MVVDDDHLGWLHAEAYAMNQRREKPMKDYEKPVIRDFGTLTEMTATIMPPIAGLTKHNFISSPAASVGFTP